MTGGFGEKMGLKTLIANLQGIPNKVKQIIGRNTQKAGLSIYKEGRPLVYIDSDVLLTFPDGKRVFQLTGTKGEPSDSVTDYLLNPYNLKRRGMASAAIMDDVKHREGTDNVSIKWTLNFDRDALNVQLHPEYRKNIKRLKEVGWELTERSYTREELKQFLTQLGYFDRGSD